MRAIKKIKNALTIVCSPSHLIACHISAHNDNQLQLHNFCKIPLEHLELEKLVVFNPTRIASLINKAIDSFGIKQSPLFLSLYGPAVQDRCIQLPYAQPTRAQLPISHAPRWYWNHCYLYPHDNTYYFYLCGIPQELILQFKLLAITHQWNLQYLSSERMALLQLYKRLYGSSFRPSQLGVAMQHTNNNINWLFSRDDLLRILAIPTSITVHEEDMGALLASTGLFVAGESYA